MNALRDKYAIVGTGKSKLGQVGLNSLALLEQAIHNALDDAGLTTKDVDGLVVRGPDDVYSHHQVMGQRLGIDVHFSTTLDNGGASQIMAVMLAVMAIDAGLASTVVCGYGRDSWTRTHSSEKNRRQGNLVPESQRPREHGPEFGHFGAVSQHAFGARRHMHEYGTTHNNTKGWLAEDHMVVTAAKQSGERAYRMAGIGPKDVSTAQIYDCFTYMAMTQLEDYGFCKKGEGGAFVRSGALDLGGVLPTNTSGGQLSEAHVEGMLQIVEGARQLQGIYEADRQVKDAQIALVSGHGGNQVCHSTLSLGRA